MQKYLITLPDSKHFTHRSDYRIREYTRCFHVLASLRDDVETQIDSGKLLSTIPPAYPHMGDQTGRYSSLFMVDNNLFMVNDADRIYKYHEEWIPYYEQKGVKAFFIYCHRFSTLPIFDKCNIPVFSLGGKPGPGMDLKQFEGSSHSISEQTNKDISVVFIGRLGDHPRKPRRFDAAKISEAIPNTYIYNSAKNPISSEKYVEYISRSKIAWCPRSVWSPPDRECNSVVGKEFEAMALECMVLKHPIGIIEPEKRIPGVHFVEVKNNSSDLIEKIEYYLEHDSERKEIAHQGRLWYERNCTITARAIRMFDQCLQAIKT